MKKDEILELARKRLSQAITADQENRARALDDMRNLVGEYQWPEDLRKEREAEGRPCLTINGLPQFLRQVTGDLRRMNPAVNVIPSDDSATKETAEIYEGLIRQIQYRSSASAVYEGAGESAAACGMGYFRILTEYEDETSFDQTIRIAPIRNQFGVYCDPEAVEPTREDASYWFITETISADDFKEAYPDKSAASVEQDGLSNIENWRAGGDIVIAEYFWREMKPAKLVRLADGRVLVDPEGPVNAVAERKTEIPVVKWAKISGTDILEGPKEFPSKYLPIIAVMGEELNIGDETYRSSVIRHAKDPQRLYNYWRSAETEMVALQPKAPFLVTAHQIAGYETFWNEANRENRPYLPYTPDPQAPAPQRVQPPVSSAGMMQQIALAAEDMKRTTGIYDASLGQRSNENSGVAIRQRQMEADVSTSIYSDNMGRAVEHCGRVLVDMIPRVFDTTRTVRTVAPDDTPGMVQVNRPVLMNGLPATQNDLTRGKFDVRVQVGPNYTTRRQEAAESMMDLAKAMPQLPQVAGDLIVKNMDWPGADEIADRLKKTLPPGMVEDQQADPMQQQAQAREQEAQKIAQELAVRKQLAETKEAEFRAQQAQFQAAKAEAEAAGSARAAMMPPQTQAIA